MGCSSPHVSAPLCGLYSFRQQEFNPCTCHAPGGFQGPGPGRGFACGAVALVHMYEHLNDALQASTRQVGGYITLLQVCIITDNLN